MRKLEKNIDGKIKLKAIVSAPKLLLAPAPWCILGALNDSKKLSTSLRLHHLQLFVLLQLHYFPIFVMTSFDPCNAWAVVFLEVMLAYI